MRKNVEARIHFFNIRLSNVTPALSGQITICLGLASKWAAIDNDE
jgi:hypothetical protein